MAPAVFPSGIAIGGYPFSDSQPGSFFWAAEVPELSDLEGPAGLRAPVGIQRFPWLIPYATLLSCFHNPCVPSSIS